MTAFLHIGASLQIHYTNKMKTSDFYYNLPHELIAQVPIQNRDQSRLLAINKKTGEFSHHKFYEIIDFLNSGDVLVLNETKVIPARLIGKLNKNDSPCEVFLLKRQSLDIWEVLVRPGKKLKIGDSAYFGNHDLDAQVIDIENDGNRIVKFKYDGVFEEILDRLGQVPLPPYIKEKLQNKDRYQTVYATNEGSVAAPTAGLHFTNELLNKIANKGVIIAKLTLDIGLGTFRPVKAETIEEHIMHSEHFSINNETANIINAAKLENRRIVCCGTTSVRSLESAAYFDENKKSFLIKPVETDTSIFIYPGYEFKIVDALITNFHLPESTLLMLVSAFCGKDNILRAYTEAIKEKYKFFSFGDASFMY